MDINNLLKMMADLRASDLHLRANAPAVYRVDGELKSGGGQKLSGSEIDLAMRSIVGENVWERFARWNEADFSYTMPGIGKFRGNLLRQRGTVGVVFRRIPEKVPGFEELRLPAAIKNIANEAQRGLILVTGTTGSGKSTTLAAIIDYINNTRNAHIVTIEDPIEFVYADKKSLITQRELLVDTNSFAEALKRVLRQDPDVILVGEMRDQETIVTALTAADTGHLVLSTLHTINAVQTINRIIDVFPPHQQNQVRVELAATLKCVISQRLLPMARGSGMAVAVELLLATPLVRKCIEDNRISEIDGAVKQGGFYGMQSFNQSLLKLYKDGLIRLEDAVEAASNPEELMMAVRGVESGSGVSPVIERD